MCLNEAQPVTRAVSETTEAPLQRDYTLSFLHHSLNCKQAPHRCLNHPLVSSKASIWLQKPTPKAVSLPLPGKIKCPIMSL